MTSGESAEVRHDQRAFSLNLLDDCSVSDHIRETGTFYELGFLEAIGEMLGPGTVVFDVGAHIGNHTIYFAGVLGLEVWAFEPNPEAYEKLVTNVAKNGLEERVTCINAALSNERGTVGMHLNVPADAGTMSIVTDPETPGALMVASKVLDDFTRSEPNPVYVKIDVEGHEAHVLKGGLGFIRSHSPDISVEVQSVDEFREVVDLLGEHYLPRDVFNATPTVLFRRSELEADRENQIHLAEYAIESALNYSQRRTWYVAQRARADELESRVSQLKDGPRVLDSLESWLDEVGRGDWVKWIEDLRNRIPANGELEDLRTLVVRLGSRPFPASLVSVVVRAVDLVDCDPLLESPVRIRRFVDGECVNEVTNQAGFGRRELGAAAVWTHIREGDLAYGPIDVAIFVGGEEAPELEAALRAFIDVPYIVVSHDAEYVFSRLAVLVGAARVYLDDPAQLQAWDRAQIIPADPIDGSPMSVARAAAQASGARPRDRVGGPLREQTPEVSSRVLLVSYYAPPATPVSVQRVAHWHRELPEISAESGYLMDVGWLTATFQSWGDPNMYVVEDGGPWKISDEWFELFRESSDKGLDPMGIAWSHYVENEMGRLGGPFTTVVLSGNPFHYFALGRTFKEKWGSKIILDFRDPFAYNPRFNYTVEQRQLAIRLESQWVAEANALISVNDFCLDIIAPTVDIPRYSVANGFDESVVDSIPAHYAPGSLVQIAYSGTVFANLPLDDLLDALPEDRFRLHHFGRDYSASQRASSDPVAVTHGLAPYEELISNLKGCAAGVVMTTGEPSTQTTKLFDYLACDLDVIIVTNGRPRTGNLHEVTKDLDGVFWVKNTPSDLKRFFRRYEPTGVKRPERKSFTRRHQTSLLFEVIRELEQA